MMNKRKIFGFPALYIAALVVAIVALTTYLTPGLYARYRNAMDDNDDARVALFLVGADLDRSMLSIGVGETPDFELGGISDITAVTIPFYVSGRAEVAIGYSVTVDFGGALPSYLTVTLSDGYNTKTLNGDDVQSVFEFEDFGAIDAYQGEASDPDDRIDFTLVLRVTDSDLITSEVHLPNANLSVTVEQLD